MKTIFAAAALAALATTGGAETLSMNGTGAGTSKTSVTEIAEGHLVMVTDSAYQGFSVVGSPMADSSGNCNGTMEMMAGKLSGGGLCVYADADGHKWVVNWVAEAMSAEGAVEGTWAITGGSGKYDGATGSGTFSSLTNQSDGTFVNTTTGEVTLK